MPVCLEDSGKSYAVPPAIMLSTPAHQDACVTIPTCVVKAEGVFKSRLSSVNSPSPIPSMSRYKFRSYEHKTSSTHETTSFTQNPSLFEEWTGSSCTIQDANETTIHKAFDDKTSFYNLPMSIKEFELVNQPNFKGGKGWEFRVVSGPGPRISFENKEGEFAVINKMHGQNYLGIGYSDATLKPASTLVSYGQCSPPKAINYWKVGVTRGGYKSNYFWIADGESNYLVSTIISGVIGVV